MLGSAGTVSSPAEPQGRADGWRSSPWAAVAATLAGTFVGVLNLTVIGVALGSISQEFDGAATSVDWVVTSYLLGVLAVMPIMGWLADRFGRTRPYLVALALFALGAVWCAWSPSLESLMVARTFQGMGGGALVPLGTLISLEAFDSSQRGVAMGIVGMVISGAPAVGPPIGGLLVATSGWRGIFLWIALFTLLALGIAALLLRDSGWREQRRLDVPGFLLVALVIVLGVVVLRQWPEWGLDSPVLWAFVSIVVVSLVLFWVRSLRTHHPIIDLRMFKNSTFALSILLTALISICLYARVNFLALELEIVQGFSPQQIGLLLAPSAVGVIATSPIGGRMTDRVGAKLPVMLGMIALSVSMWLLAELTPDSGPVQVIAIGVLQGAGLGLASMPLTVVAMNCLPQSLVAQGNSMLNLDRQLAGAVGMALSGAILIGLTGSVAPRDLHPELALQGFSAVFWFGFWVAASGLLASLFLPNHPRVRN